MPERAATRALPAVVVAVFAVVTGVVTWAVVHSAPAQTPVGARYPADDRIVAARTVSVQQPYGSLNLGVTAPRHELPTDVANSAGRTSVPAPSGGAFLGVTAEIGDASGSRVASVRSGLVVNSLVSLIVDGRRLPLYTPSDVHADCPSVCVAGAGSAVWVGVTGDTTKLQFAVAYDGVSQTVDVRTGRVAAGRAAGLNAKGTSSTSDCGTFVWSPGFTAAGVDPTCSATVTRTPYLEGLGWAPAGSDWVGVSATFRSPHDVRLRGGGTVIRESVLTTGADVGYRLSGGTLVYRNDATGGSGELGPGRLGGDIHELVAFRVPAASGHRTLTLTVDYPLDSGHEIATAARSHAIVTWTVTA